MGGNDRTLADKYCSDSFYSIMGLYKFSIPLYRRDYKWTSENWDEFYNDLDLEKSVF